MLATILVNFDPYPDSLELWNPRAVGMRVRPAKKASASLGSWAVRTATSALYSQVYCLYIYMSCRHGVGRLFRGFPLVYWCTWLTKSTRWIVGL